MDEHRLMHAPGQVVFSGTSFAPRDDATRIAPPVRFLGGGFGCARINKDVNTPTSFLSALSRSPLSSLSDAHPDSQPIVARRPFQNKNGVRAWFYWSHNWYYHTCLRENSLCFFIRSLCSVSRTCCMFHRSLFGFRRFSVGMPAKRQFVPFFVRAPWSKARKICAQGARGIFSFSPLPRKLFSWPVVVVFGSLKKNCQGYMHLDRILV